jgi:DNA-binding NtrC family response regulator
MTRVLIVDDDPVQLRLTAEMAANAGFVPLTQTDGRSALALLSADPSIAVVILDLVMPDLDGMAVLEALRRSGVTTPVIVQTSNSSPEIIASAMQNGAVDFFITPVAPERLITSLHNALKRDALETAIRAEHRRGAGALRLGDIIAKSPAMDRVFALVSRAAKSPVPVLLEGEAGVGKELMARVIQGMSDRAGKPFVTVNCGTVAPNLLESTLFGYKKGAFPGAIADQPGKFAEAHGGMLFLDEVGELSPALQAKLLRVLEHGDIEPLGSARPERVNVRVISATNQRLLNLARSGAFREDLYYRLNVFPIYVPPLRQRPEDLAPLIGHFIARLSAEAGRRVTGISPEALLLLKSYDWPGNIRQLENVLYRAIVLAEQSTLEAVDFPQVAAQTTGREAAVKSIQSLNAPSAPVHIDFTTGRVKQTEGFGTHPDRFLTERGEVTALADLERELIIFAIKHHAGRMSRVARALKIGRSTLYRKLREYGLEDAIESDAA